MQPLVPLVLPSLYPPSNDCLYLFYPFLTVLNAPSKTMLQKRDVDTSLMQHAGIELGPHRYDKPLRYATLTCRIVHTLR